MTISAVTCTCGGAENLVRKTLRNANYKGWLDMKIYQGKGKQGEFFDSLPDNVKKMDGVALLRTHLKGLSSYVVVVGYDDVEFRWSDIKSGKITNRLDAEVIVRDFM